MVDENVAETPMNNRALNSFTQDATANLIQFLTTFLQGAEGKNAIKSAFLSSTAKGSVFYKPYPLPLQVSASERAVAVWLEHICDQIQSQIGSAETMPKGLIIHFALHLFDASYVCEKRCEQKSTLLAQIKKEIVKIRQVYPELAKAAENLHHAIALYHPPHCAIPEQTPTLKR